METDPLVRLDEGLFIAAAPHTMMGLHLGSRMTAVRLRDGTILLHSPVRLTPSLREAVDRLGTVSEIVAPSLYHHVYVTEWAAIHPEACVVAAPGLERKRRDLRIGDTIDAAKPRPSWEGTLVPVTIEGCMLGETMFVHTPTRTVVSADLMENFATSEHLPTRLYLKAAGIHGKIGWAYPLRALYRDRAAAKRSFEQLLEHDFERAIIAHGEIVASGAKDAVRQTYAGWVL